MKGTLGDLIFQFPIAIKKVKMRPAIAFRPVDQLFSIVNQAWAAYFHISIETLVN
ncbi:hypothetical protein D3C87_1751400 [compost metagenome]